VGIIARDPERLMRVQAEIHALGRRAFAVPADVADAEAVEHAAQQIEAKLGPITVWVNNAMATAFAPVEVLSPAEFRRGTEVTYLGQVHGTLSALRRMRVRDAGTIVNVGSALAYRAIPLQSVYCAAKFAVRGFTDSLRSELLHEGSGIHLTMVHLAAMNTPQFDWALNKMGRKTQPVPPIFQPEVAARAILFAATHRRREVWVGFPTVKAIVANALFPGLLDHILARSGYSGQITEEKLPAEAPANLYHPVTGPYGAHGRFDAESRSESWEMWTSRHHGAVVGIAAALLGFGAMRLLKRRR
jgi:short-subunit dehydrogenase